MSRLRLHRQSEIIILTNITRRIQVKPGDAGLQEFTERIRQLFRLEDDIDISLTFGCKEPMSGQHLKLEGVGAFDAAVHCASVAAAERAVRTKPSIQPESPLNDFSSPPALSRFSAADAIQRSPRNFSPYPSDPLPGNPQAGQSPFESHYAISPALAAEYDPATYTATSASTSRSFIFSEECPWRNAASTLPSPVNNPLWQ